MGRDTIHYPKLLQALSSLALDTARDPGAATAALGTLCQGVSTLPGNNSFQYPIFLWAASSLAAGTQALSEVQLAACTRNPGKLLSAKQAWKAALLTKIAPGLSQGTWMGLFSSVGFGTRRWLHKQQAEQDPNPSPLLLQGKRTRLKRKTTGRANKLHLAFYAQAMAADSAGVSKEGTKVQAVMDMTSVDTGHWKRRKFQIMESLQMKESWINNCDLLKRVKEQLEIADALNLSPDSWAVSGYQNRINAGIQRQPSLVTKTQLLLKQNPPEDLRVVEPLSLSPSPEAEMSHSGAQDDLEHRLLAPILCIDSTAILTNGMEVSLPVLSLGSKRLMSSKMEQHRHCRPFTKRLGSFSPSVFPESIFWLSDNMK
ncbi:hypothetical protein HGM15179_015629 [Zosterops borbonicus]|uniref:Uncharacterized protein n=1 Tax=Zosterops borbonicus TaxID=364589 RepID=A0A8K1G4G9_9PASS|nr:hypothetical protein HGM15179_015629 [Zosterops borbonicus]